MCITAVETEMYSLCNNLLVTMDKCKVHCSVFIICIIKSAIKLHDNSKLWSESLSCDYVQYHKSTHYFVKSNHITPILSYKFFMNFISMGHLIVQLLTQNQISKHGNLVHQKFTRRKNLTCFPVTVFSYFISLTNLEF